MSTPMVPNNIHKRLSLTLAPGQSIQVQILNEDGSVLSTLLNDTPPVGTTFEGSISYSGLSS